jgi:hypothetical protein
LARYELDIGTAGGEPGGGEAAGGEVAIDGLSILIPLKEEFGEYLHALPTSGNFRWYLMTMLLPDGPGVLWDSKTFSGKSSVLKKTAGNAVPVVWLGGVLRGLCWFADNDRGWVPNEEKPAITVSRENKVITLGLHFISQPFTLKESRKIVFGLLATPPKPLPKDYRIWNRGDPRKHGQPAGCLTSCDAFAPWEVPVKGDHCMAYWPKDYDWDFAKRASDRQRKSKHPKYATGRPLMIYHDMRFTPGGRDAAYFNWEWFRNGEGSYPPSKVDCLVWYMNEWYGRNIMDGIYIDDVFPVPDWNHDTGTAYLLPDGKVQPGNPMFPYRDYLKRMFSLFHVYGKAPVITTHMTHTLAMPFQAFATVMFDGEDMGVLSDPNATFIDNWPLDRLITLNIAERTGLVPVLMLKGDYVTRGRSEKAWAHMIYRTYRSAVAVWQLFDMNNGLGYQMPAEFIAVLQPYLEPDTTVHPFWSNQETVKVKALLKAPVTDPNLLPRKWPWRTPMLERIGRDPLRATLWKKPDRALLIVVNFLKMPVKGEVTLDLAALGLSKEEQARLKLEDVDRWPPPPGDDLQNLQTPKAMEADPSLTAPDGEQPSEFDAGEMAVEDKKKVETLVLTNGTLALTVKPHDFRLIELTWPP